MSVGRSTCPTALPWKDRCVVPSPAAHATAQTRWIHPDECLLPASQEPFLRYFVSDPGLSPLLSAHGHLRCNRHNHSHPATRHSSGLLPDNSLNVGDLSVAPPKTHVLFLSFSSLYVRWSSRASAFRAHIARPARTGQGDHQFQIC